MTSSLPSTAELTSEVKDHPETPLEHRVRRTNEIEMEKRRI